MPYNHPAARSKFSQYCQKGLFSDPEKKLSMGRTTESEPKFGLGDLHTLFYDPTKESDP